MNFFSAMIRDLVMIAFIASFCELLLPKSQSKGPVQLVFGLYFLGLMLSPILSFAGGVELSAIDFESLGEASLVEVDPSYDVSAVYDDAADMLEQDISGRLEAIYRKDDISVEIEMEESGFRWVVVRGMGRDAVVAEEVKELLAAEYGMDRSVVKVLP